MPYFHGTHRDNLPSIRRHGLGGVDTGPRSEECERGVYLAYDPRLSMMIMLGHFMATASDDASPKEEIASWVFLLIDDSRLDPSKLVADPQVTRWKGSWLYRGVIDVTNAPLLEVADIERAEACGALPPKSEQDWVVVGPTYPAGAG